MEEIWKEIGGFKGKYEVSNLGRVRSLLNCRLNPKSEPELIKSYKTKAGYYQVTLWNHKKCVHKLIHRLVAEAFIPNPNNYPVVNHKDEDPSNNVWTNLEWVTQSYNCSYGNRNKRILETRLKNGSPNQQKKIVGTRISDGFRIEFDSIAEAGRFFGEEKSKATSINNCLTGRAKSAIGYIWCYKE